MKKERPNSRPQTQSYIQQAIWTGGLFSFFLERKSIVLCMAHARVTQGTRHAARPNLDDSVPQT